MIADLTDGQGRPADDVVAQAMTAPWKRIAEIEGGTALILWQRHRQGPAGEGAALQLPDPDGTLAIDGQA